MFEPKILLSEEFARFASTVRELQEELKREEDSVKERYQMYETEKETILSQIEELNNSLKEREAKIRDLYNDFESKRDAIYNKVGIMEAEFRHSMEQRESWS